MSSSCDLGPEGVTQSQGDFFNPAADVDKVTAFYGKNVAFFSEQKYGAQQLPESARFIALFSDDEPPRLFQSLRYLSPASMAGVS